ncbi:MAG: hypothetical protein OJF49_000362 [Ktedonobacterales bacterium]|jgi:hypothetical protein|nr:MAG: hypothetical protein OJF49_000362 [Ktedonobacterales bacterium]
MASEMVDDAISLDDSEAILRAVAQDRSNAAKRFRVVTNQMNSALVLGRIVTAMTGVVIWIVLTHANHDDAYFLNGDLIMLGLALLLLPGAASVKSGSHYQKFIVASWALRETAASGDDTLIPLADEQPVSLLPEELAAEPPAFPRPRWIDDTHMLAYQTVFPLVVIPFAFLPLYAEPLAYTFYGRSAMTSVMIGPVPLLYCILLIPLGMALTSVAIAAASLTFPSLLVDEDGLSWQYGRFRKKTERVRWDDVRSFIRIDRRDPTLYKPQPAYILEGGHATLAWGYVVGYRSPHEDRDTTYLERLIVTRTGLPLRDATLFAVRLGRAAGGFIGDAWADRLFVRKGSRLPELPTGLAQALAISPAQRRRARLMLLLSFAPLLVYAGGLLGAHLFGLL